LKDSLSQQGMTVESFDVLVGGDPSFKGKNQQQSDKGRSRFTANNLVNPNSSGPVQDEIAAPIFLGAGTISLFA
jgi:flagellar hook-length control protein FliK